jgi:hypothetical protein
MNTLCASLLFWQTLFDQQASFFIEQLGSERFAVREAASAMLVRMVRSDGGQALRTRLEAATHSSDPETARRAEGVLAEFYNVKPSSYSLFPWIDMLPATVHNREAIIEQYRQRCRGTSYAIDTPRWQDFRFATALYVEDLLRSGWPRSAVQNLLDDMAKAERQYKLAHQMAEDY